MSFELNNKKVFLTGSTGTIGSSIAKKLNESGATIICTSTSKDKLDMLKNEIGDNHYYYSVDLNDSVSLENSLDEILTSHKDISVIINNAGNNDDNLSIKMKDNQWNDVMNINLTSKIHM